MAGDSGQTPSPPLVCRLSVLAVIAFLLSLASVFLSAGATAIVLGFLSLHRIGRSGHALWGRGLAKVAIVLPILMAAFLLLASVSNVHGIAPELRCGTNLSQIGKAMLIYANTHDDQLPTPSRWCDLMVAAGVEPDKFRCRGTEPSFSRHPYPLEFYLYLRHRSATRRQGPCDYAMNEHMTSISASPDVVLCFESGSGWNRVGGPEILTTDHHDGRGCNVMFLDTHVEFIKAGDLGRLKWKATP